MFIVCQLTLACQMNIVALTRLAALFFGVPLGVHSEYTFSDALKNLFFCLFADESIKGSAKKLVFLVSLDFYCNFQRLL